VLHGYSWPGSRGVCEAVTTRCGLRVLLPANEHRSDGAAHLIAAMPSERGRQRWKSSIGYTSTQGGKAIMYRYQAAVVPSFSSDSAHAHWGRNGS
jgi:hypothetical protein